MGNKDIKLTKMHVEAEVKSGLSILDQIRHENVIAKNILSDFVQLDISKFDVDWADYFQQKFIEIDQIVDLLRHEMITMLITKHKPASYIEPWGTPFRIEMLKQNVLEVKDEFNLLKNQFEEYLVEAHLPGMT
jgi:hypothetical protein